jgi:curved DNA-binding protein CbpA
MATAIEQTHYERLNVSRVATLDEIKRAYRTLALKWHPDKNPDNVTEATEVFKKIRASFEVLTDQDRRRMYDATLRPDETVPHGCTDLPPRGKSSAPSSSSSSWSPFDDAPPFSKWSSQGSAKGKRGADPTYASFGCAFHQPTAPGPSAFSTQRWYSASNGAPTSGTFFDTFDAGKSRSGQGGPRHFF